MGFRQRPEAAFESLYARHVRDVYGYALGVLGSSADAEDVTQTTFLNAYRALQRGQRPRASRSWLFAIAHNVCRQRFRQAARRPREVELHDGFAVEEEADAPSAQDISRALQGLPFTQRSALVMRELEGRSQAEIAEALGVSVSAVETLLFRARRGMREQLESALTCGEAARAISRQLDGASSRAERAALRAHLRVCEECATFARRARARSGAMRRLGGALPLPASLLSWSLGGAGGGAVAAAPAAGLGMKLLAGTAVAALCAGATERVVVHRDPPSRVAAASVPPSQAAAPAPGAAITGADTEGARTFGWPAARGGVAAGSSRTTARGERGRVKRGAKRGGHASPGRGRGRAKRAASTPLGLAAGRAARARSASGAARSSGGRSSIRARNGLATGRRVVAPKRVTPRKAAQRDAAPRRAARPPRSAGERPAASRGSAELAKPARPSKR